MVLAIAYSSDNFMSRQLYCIKLSYEIGSHRSGRGDYGVIKCFGDRGEFNATYPYLIIRYCFLVALIDTNR